MPGRGGPACNLFEGWKRDGGEGESTFFAYFRGYTISQRGWGFLILNFKGALSFCWCFGVPITVGRNATNKARLELPYFSPFLPCVALRLP